MSIYWPLFQVINKKLNISNSGVHSSRNVKVRRNFPSFAIRSLTFSCVFNSNSYKPNVTTFTLRISHSTVGDSNIPNNSLTLTVAIHSVDTCLTPE